MPPESQPAPVPAPVTSISSPIMPLSPFFEIVSKAYGNYKEKFSVIAYIQMPIFVLAVVLSLLKLSNTFFPTNGSTLIAFLFAVLTFVLIVASIIIQIVASLSTAKILSNQYREISAKESYLESLKLFFPYLWLSILVGLVVVGGYGLFVIPGIILSGYILFAIFPFINDGKRGIEAIQASFYYVKGNWWGVFWRSLAFSLSLGIVAGLSLALLGLIIFGATGILHPLISLLIDSFQSVDRQAVQLAINELVASPKFLVSSGLFSLISSIVSTFFLYPIVTSFQATLYNELRSTKGAFDVSSVEVKKTKNILVGFSLFGIVAPFIFLILFSVIVVFIMAMFKPVLRNPQYQTDQETVSTTTLTFDHGISFVPKEGLVKVQFPGETASGQDIPVQMMLGKPTATNKYPEVFSAKYAVLTKEEAKLTAEGVAKQYLEASKKMAQFSGVTLTHVDFASTSAPALYSVQKTKDVTLKNIDVFYIRDGNYYDFTYSDSVEEFDGALPQVLDMLKTLRIE